MSLLDELKSTAMQAAKELEGAAKQVVGEVTGQAKVVVMNKLPVSLAEMQAMPQADMTKPQNTVAMCVAALCMYPVDKDAAIEMLNFLKGPSPITEREKQFIADRFRDDKWYVPASYFAGAVPTNNYTPSKPYTIEVHENPYSRQQINEGYLKVFVRSGGADTERSVTLRHKPSTNQWFLWEQMLLSDIRPPQESDPWA